MPLDSAAVADLKTAIGVARKRDLNFALCLGKKPEGTVFLTHRQKGGGSLLRDAKAKGETQRGVQGTMRVSGKVMSLTCAEAPPPGTAQTVRDFLSRVIGMAMKVVILDKSGAQLEAGGDANPVTSDGEAAPDAADSDAAAKWRKKKADLKPKLSKALSEGTVDRSKLRAAWQQALEAADEGDHRTALKVAERINTLLERRKSDQREPVGADDFLAGRADDSLMRAKWQAAVKAFKPQLDKVLARGARQASILKAEWELAESLAKKGDHATAFGKLDRVLKGVKAAKHKDPNGPEVESAEEERAETAEDRDAENAEDGRTETAGDRGAANTEGEHAKTGMEDLSVLMSGNVDGKLAELKDRYAKQKDDIAEVSTYKPETRKAEKLLRGLSFKTRELERLIAERKPFGIAKKHLHEIEKTVQELKAEKGAIDAASALRTEVMVKLAALEPTLKVARSFYDVGRDFTADVESFKTENFYVANLIREHKYQLAKRRLDVLRVAAERLVARKREFDTVAGNHDRARVRRKEYLKKYKAAQAVPHTLTDTKTLHDKVAVGANRLEAAWNTKNWEDAITAAGDGIKDLDSLIALKEGADAEVGRRAELEKRWSDLELNIQRLRRGKTITTEKRQLRIDVRGHEDRFLEAFYQRCDLSAAEEILKQLEQSLADVDAVIKADGVAQHRQGESKSAYSKKQAEIEKASDVVPMTPNGLATFNALVEASTAFRAAQDKGAEDWQKKLADYEVAAQAMMDREEEEQAGLRQASGLCLEKVPTIATKYREAELLALANKPALDADLERLKVALAGFNQKYEARRYREAIGPGDEVIAIANQILGQETQAKAATSKIKEDFQARWTKALAGRIEAVLRYDPKVDAGLPAKLQDLKNLRDEVSKAEAEERWHDATRTLGILETPLRDLEAFKDTYEGLKADFDWVTAELRKHESKVKQAGDMAACTERLAEKKAEFDVAAHAFNVAWKKRRFAPARASWPSVLSAADALIALKSEHDPFVGKHKEALKAYNAVDKKHGNARKIRILTPKLAELHDALEDAADSFQAAFEAFDYDRAKTLAPGIGKAADAVLAASNSADYKRAKQQAQAASKAAKIEIRDTPEANLRKKPAKAKLKLLKGLRALKTELTDEERALQRKVYAAMDLDPAFVALDDKRREELTIRIREDAELMAAKDTWASKTVDERLALLRGTLKAECEIYGMPMPTVDTFSQPMPGMAGNYNKYSNVIYVNVHPTALDDFFDMIETIVHENAHNYQYYLVTRLEEGLIAEGDPEYLQAQMFAANYGDGDNVTSEESPEIYKKQPTEEHAWKTGEDVKRMLQAPPPSPE